MDGLTGLIHELQACYEHYHENTGALRMLWHTFTGKTPWTDPDYEVEKGYGQVTETSKEFQKTALQGVAPFSDFC